MNVVPLRPGASPSDYMDAEFENFLHDHSGDPELPLLVYAHLCERLDTVMLEVGAVSSYTYSQIQNTVNGLLNEAASRGVRVHPHRLQNNRRVG